ncbi:MAG TPA: cytochrome c oxidase subunit II [Acidimicrobiales bacterium]|nr:cytochrome c oxidase subunit II [Acidimicrobiales bacterium]
MLPLAILAPIVLAGCQLPSFGAYKGATAQGQDAYKLWQGFFIAGIVIGGFVLLLIVWAVFRYPRRHQEIPRQTQYRHGIEIAYTVIPLLIVAALFVFTVITENEVDAVPKSDVTIDVTAFQWGWQFYYPATGKVVVGETLQSPQMVLPVNEAVTIHLKSADVIHGFYVPMFNFSRYAQPGVVNTFNFNVFHTGVYRGQCTQLCGLYHSLMLFSVRAVSPADFEAWVHQTGGQSPSIGHLKAQIHAQGPGA